MNPTLKILLKGKRRAMGKGNRVKTRNNRPQKMLYPWALENKYARMISAQMKAIVKMVESAYRQAGEAILRGDSLHQDASPGKTTKITYQELKAKMMEMYPERYEGGQAIALKKMGAEVKGFTDKEFQKQMRQYLGFDFDTGAEWWPDVLDSWGERNYELIRSMAFGYIARVNDLAEKAVTKGTGYFDLMKDIEALGVSLPEGRSRLIARDQIGKLNGRITKATQEELGLDEYVWMTAMDERVRGNPGGKYPDSIPSHYIMEGLVCRWDDASVYSDDGGKTWHDRTWEMPDEHPGEPIQCRCTSAPNWRPLLQELDSELDVPAE